jgi:hypothetical protein
MLRATVVICGILLGMLLAAVVVASGYESVLVGLRELLVMPWGIVTLLDLSVGLLFVAAWITVIEPRPHCAAGWIIALFLLGNMVMLIFLLWRTRRATCFSELFLPPQRHD